jgi:Glycosyl transferase family 11
MTSIRKRLSQLLRGRPFQDQDPRADIRLQNSVIVRFSGGLANQMICYKLGRYVADLKKSSFVIDANLYEGDITSNRNFQLNKYDIRYDVLISSERTMRDIKATNAITFITKESLPLPSPSEEQKAHVIDFLQKNDIIYCDFWLAMCLRAEMDEHAEAHGILDDLRLDPSRSLNERDLACLEKIRNAAESVAIHVRRGDFATHDGNLLLAPTYYNRSIGAFESRLERPVFFVFSDDIEWCRKNLRATGEMHFVDWTDERQSFKDMFLASSCRHFILSNESTFSHQIVQLSVPHSGRIVMTSGPQDLARNAAQAVGVVD